MRWPLLSRWPRPERDEAAGLECAPRVEVPQSRYSAGETITGRLVDGLPSARIELVRIERRPGMDRAIVIARTLAAGRDGAFRLTVPPDALPTATGVRCSIAHVLRAVDGHRAVEAPVALSASARVHLDARRCRFDRLLCDWDARHFHVELREASLHGGGSVAGRVHRHGAWVARTMTVEARCQECWQDTVTVRGLARWHETTLWHCTIELEVDPDATWSAFRFDLPAGLPLAVEARSIAWRYELWARRARRGPDETAALTPLLHEDAGAAIGV